MKEDESKTWSQLSRANYIATSELNYAPEILKGGQEKGTEGPPGLGTVYLFSKWLPANQLLRICASRLTLRNRDCRGMPWAIAVRALTGRSGALRGSFLN